MAQHVCHWSDFYSSSLWGADWNESVHLTWTTCCNKQHLCAWLRWDHLHPLYNFFFFWLYHQTERKRTFWIWKLSGWNCDCINNVERVVYHKHCSRMLSVYWKTGAAKEAATRQSWMAVLIYWKRTWIMNKIKVRKERWRHDRILHIFEMKLC